jgi:hypothetical protein
MSNQRDRRKKKKKKNTFEAEVFAFLQKSMKAALDTALDEIFKDWK